MSRADFQMIDLTLNARPLYMTKKYVTLALLIVSTCCRAQDDVSQSEWAVTPLSIDGKATEWKLPLQLYDDVTKLFFSFANDDQNVYLCFQAPDDMFQAKIMRAGMEVSLSNRGKNKVSITFPIGQTSDAEVPKEESETNGYTDKKARRANFILQNTMMEVKGFSTRNGIISVNDSSGLRAGINWDESNKLTYEIAIPFKEWFGPTVRFSSIPKEITLDVTIFQLKQPHHGSDIGMSGAPRGGGGRHRQQQNNDSGVESQVMPGQYKYALYEKSKLKQRFMLAQGAGAK